MIKKVLIILEMQKFFDKLAEITGEVVEESFVEKVLDDIKKYMDARDLV